MTWYEIVAKSTACCGVEENRIVIFLERIGHTEASEERVGDNEKSLPTGVAVGAWITRRLVGEAFGMSVKDGAKKARPFGVE